MLRFSDRNTYALRNYRGESSEQKAFQHLFLSADAVEYPSVVHTVCKVHDPRTHQHTILRHGLAQAGTDLYAKIYERMPSPIPKGNCSVEVGLLPRYLQEAAQFLSSIATALPRPFGECPVAYLKASRIPRTAKGVY